MQLRVFLLPEQTQQLSYNEPPNCESESNMSGSSNQMLTICYYTRKIIENYLLHHNGTIILMDTGSRHHIEQPKVTSYLINHQNPTTISTGNPIVMFDPPEGQVLVIFLKQNFQDIIFIPSRVKQNTQKWLRDHLKKMHFLGRTPYRQHNISSCSQALNSKDECTHNCEHRVQFHQPRGVD